MSTDSMSTHPWFTFALFVGLCFSVAAIGSVWTSMSVRTWYVRLRKPSFNPPGWVFGPVWSALYFMMATSAWLVWRQGGWQGARTALLLFFIQLGLNLAWSGLFFRLRRPGLAAADILALLVAIIGTAMEFRAFSEIAFWLMVPYAIWVSFASVLNFSIWRLNAGQS
jgi:tryptophan-rich sensory protein